MSRRWVRLAVGLVLAGIGFFLISIDIYSLVGWILIVVGVPLLLSCLSYPHNPPPDHILGKTDRPKRINSELPDIPFGPWNG